MKSVEESSKKKKSDEVAVTISESDTEDIKTPIAVDNRMPEQNEQIAGGLMMERARQARNRNELDYDKGGLLKRKAILSPECRTEEQKNAFRRRIGMSLLSGVIVMGGTAINLGTNGAASRVVVVLKAVLGQGLKVTGNLSWKHTVSKKSVLDGCDGKAWSKKVALGCIGGVVIGITTLVVSPLPFSKSVVRSATTSIFWIGSSVISDAAKVLVDKEKVTWKESVFHVFYEGVLGAALGVAGYAIWPNESFAKYALEGIIGMLVSRN